MFTSALDSSLLPSIAMNEAYRYLTALTIAVERELGLVGSVLLPTLMSENDSKTTTWRFASQGADKTTIYVRINTNKTGGSRSPEQMRVIAEGQAYIQERTSIPIPRVLRQGSLSAPFEHLHYIIVEAAPGVQLHQVWKTWSAEAQETFVRDMADTFAQLAKITLPSSTSFLGSHLARDSTEAVLALTSHQGLKNLHERLRLSMPSAYHVVNYTQDEIVVQSDYQSANLLVDPDSGKLTGHIDFAHVKLSPRYFDFASPEWIVDAVEDEPSMPLLPAQEWTWTRTHLDGARTLSEQLGTVFREELEKLEPGSGAILKETRPFREWCRAAWLLSWGHPAGREAVEVWVKEMDHWLDSK